MSVVVHHLSKQYGQQMAVNDISFSVVPGEIVGFLGPNGAGKSTTLKIISGFIPPSAGTVVVAGYSVHDDPQHVRQRIGYLPEHNPLYLDMYVHEFLRFIGNLYGLRGGSLTKRVAEMIDLCGLTLEQNKRMESLSKGYRQRVGLAQALIHQPDVLVLDEPTTGLDPNQIVEIRQLIREVSKEKTVIFSTHIMQEVQALCSRVLVINKGVLVADEKLADLMASGRTRTAYVVEFEKSIDKAELMLSGVEEVVEINPRTFRMISAEGVDVRPAVFRMAADRQLSLLGLRQEENSLEAVFKELTQSPS